LDFRNPKFLKNWDFLRFFVGGGGFLSKKRG